MPSPTYALFRQAVRHRRRVACTYDGHSRILCPAILGRSDGREAVLAFQVGGSSSGSLPPGGAWKCLYLDKVARTALVEGTFQIGEGRAAEQTCVVEVDVDATTDE